MNDIKFAIGAALLAAAALAHDAQAATRKPSQAQTQTLQTRSVAASTSWSDSRQKVWRDIARYDSAPMISGGGY